MAAKTGEGVKKIPTQEIAKLFQDEKQELEKITLDKLLIDHLEALPEAKAVLSSLQAEVLPSKRPLLDSKEVFAALLAKSSNHL